MKIKDSKYLMALDPGNVNTGWCVYDLVKHKPIHFGYTENNLLLRGIENNWLLGDSSKDWLDCIPDWLAIEMIASYGMPVGETTFETVYWIGMFVHAFGKEHSTKIYRKDVKMNLCGSMKAKDANIRQVLFDRYGLPGTKKNPGLLYGANNDTRSAIAVAVTWDEIVYQKELLYS